MYRQIEFAPAKTVAGQAVAIALFENTRELPEGYKSLDALIGGSLSAALKRPDFSTAKGKVTAIFPAGDDKNSAQRVWVLGLGDKTKVNLDAVRLATARLVGALFVSKATGVTLIVSPVLTGAPDSLAPTPDGIGRAIADGFVLANFEFTQFKGAGAKPPGAKADSNGVLDLSVGIEAGFLASAKRGLTINDGVNLTRKLAATPPNVANPAYLVDQARAMAKKTGLKCTIIDARQAAKLGMGGLLAVGAAGSTPPALICLEHKPRSTKNAKTGPILIVGKAVTFDTGGYSIKPADGMDRMKYDKCGGMAVLGAMNAIASLKLPVHVVGLVPAAENMINQNAYRPGDIVTFCNGVTGEITNTDAEGRVILADALAYGTRTYKPAAVVDLATLTGGVVVALGSLSAGCFCSDSELRGKLFDAADFTGERLWHLPLWAEHRDMIKGTHGDIVNSAGREASPIQGAAFLSFFIEPDGKTKLPTLPWAHLDIAGTAEVKKETGIFASGPTGFGVRLLVRLVENWV